MIGPRKRIYVLESEDSEFPVSIGKYLYDNDIPFHMTGFIDSPHRIIVATKSEIKSLKDFIKGYPVKIRKGM